MARKENRTIDQMIEEQQGKVNKTKETLKNQEDILKELKAKKQAAMLEKVAKAAEERGITVEELLEEMVNGKK